jgi:hypothetical protein
MYRHGQKFDRRQLIFLVEATLVSALDRIESCQPTSNITWADRLNMVNGVDADAQRLNAYERGALETAGMMLGVLYAQLTDDGLGIYDALVCADNFQDAVEQWVERVWQDEGKTVMQRIHDLPKGGWQIEQAYSNYPNCNRHAEAFVNEVFGDYLA